MKIKLIIFLVLFSAGAKSQVPRAGDPEYTTQSRFLVLRIVPKDKSAKIFLTGQEALNIDLKKEAKIISVTLLKNQKKEILHLEGDGDTYEIQGIPTGPGAYEIGVKTEVRGTQEEMKVIVPNAKP